MATIKDIARKAGVSVATVSHVIHNTRRAHEDKRRRVLEAIRNSTAFRTPRRGDCASGKATRSS